MSSDQLQWLLRCQEVALPPLPVAPPRVLLCGDTIVSSLNVTATFSQLDETRSYSSLTNHLGSTSLALGQRRMVTKAKLALGEQGGVVGLCLGSSPAKEMRDPSKTALNVMKLWEQFQQEGIPCFILSLVPVLAEEARGDPYSSCWSSQVLLLLFLLLLCFLHLDLMRGWFGLPVLGHVLRMS